MKSRTGIVFKELGDGVPVVVMHGMPTDHRSVHAVLEPVFARTGGFRRVYPDLPGVGRSTGVSRVATADALVAQVLDFLDEQSERLGGRVALVGHSWSAGPVLEFVRRHPDRVIGVALLVPSIRVKAPAPAPSALVNEPGAFDHLDPQMRAIAERLTTRHERRVADRIAKAVDPGRLSADSDYLLPLISAELTYEQELLHVGHDGPALIVAGKQDSVSGTDDPAMVAKRFPRATFAIIDGAGHLVAFERQSLWRSLFFDWLARLREATGAPLPRGALALPRQFEATDPPSN